MNHGRLVVAPTVCCNDAGRSVIVTLPFHSSVILVAVPCGRTIRQENAPFYVIIMMGTRNSSLSMPSSFRLLPDLPANCDAPMPEGWVSVQRGGESYKGRRSCTRLERPAPSYTFAIGFTASPVGYSTRSPDSARRVGPKGADAVVVT